MNARMIGTLYKGVAAIAVGVLLLSCSVGRNYSRPDLGMPDAYSGHSTETDSSLALLSWNEFFTDTTLQALIRRALAHNFDLRVALTRVEAYQSYAKQARAAWLPALQAQATASTSNPSENSLNGISLSNFLEMSHLEDYTLAATVSWELDIWGKIRRSKEAALADYLGTFEAARAVQTAIVAQVADGYFNLLMMDEQLAIARRNVLLSDSIVQMIQLQKNAGVATQLAVQQAEGQRQNALILIPQLEQAIALQENGLRLLTGDWPGEIPRTAQLDDIPVRRGLTTGVPAELLAYRPDVRASEMALKAANARVGVAQGNLYPSLTLTATGGLNAFEASNWFSTPASLFSVASAGITQPIFARRALKTQVEVARAELEQRETEFRASVTTAVHEVTNALVRIDKARSEQEVASDRVETLNQAVHNAQMLFRSGMANYLEVISAQSSALQAQLDKALITRQQLAAQLELYHALGGGWAERQ
ncbi:MAG TPA: efflux transporter outer membrane subunit [Cyclobacteriaceae bacterium]